MKGMIFGATMFFLGLCLSPRATVAGKDETLAVLCWRFQGGPALAVKYAHEQAAILAKNGDFGEHAAKLAFISAMENVRDMVCVSRAGR
jgi:hypothetical protein